MENSPAFRLRTGKLYSALTIVDFDLRKKYQKPI